nr:E-beta-farnesene synthase [Tanacetum cinerariifolium]
MADVNVNAHAEQLPVMAPPNSTDEQILPRSSWFWDTVRYVKNTRSYSRQLDEQWFNLNKDILKDALQITPVDNNNSFSSPPTPDVHFVNDLGYPMWEESTQSIHSFIKDKKNLAFHTQGKKKANPLVIPSVRFTKLIIHHLQSKHKFHSRPDSPLHLPYEEYVLGYLKFSAKVTKREVFGMPILNELITDDIRGGLYYNEYLEKVAKHQRYLDGEEGSDPDSPTPKPAKATKPKATKQSMPLVPKAAPKKRRLVKETSDEPSPAKRSKPGLVTKKRKPTISLRLVDEFVDEGVPENEPRFDDKEANLQRAMEESLKDVHATHRGLLPPVVFREPDSGRRQPLPECCNEVYNLITFELKQLVLNNEKKHIFNVIQIKALTSMGSKTGVNDIKKE